MNFMMRRTIWAFRIYFILPYELVLRIIFTEFKTYLDINGSWFLMPLRNIFKNSTANAYKISILNSKNKFYKGFPYSDNKDFQKWLDIYYPKPVQKKIFCISGSLTSPPTCSFIMPLYKPNVEYLLICIESILDQSSDDWELCIYTDGVPNLNILKILKAYAFLDFRIRFKVGNVRGHISKASNQAIKMTTGKYVALIDQDDFIPPHAVEKIVEYISENTNIDFIYTDEAKIDNNGNLSLPFFKPDWSPDYLNSIMYVCHMLVIRNAFLQKLGGFRVGFEGAQDWDLVLRASEKTNKIGHIQDILYYWRKHPTSEAMEGCSSKPYAHENAKKAITESLQRKKEFGVVKTAPFTDNNGFIVDYKIINPGKISIIIPFRDKPHLLDNCLNSISGTMLDLEIEIILIDNSSTEPKTFEVIEKWKIFFGNILSVFKVECEFNYSKIHNRVISKISGKYLLFLNNDTEIISKDWLYSLIKYAQKERIGAVGAKLLYSDKTIQHAGVIMGLGGAAAHAYRMSDKNSRDYFYRSKVVNNFSCVTAACLMCKYVDFIKVGGFNEDFSHNYNDVDLCLKFLEEGLYNVFLPHLEVVHHESKTRGDDLASTASDEVKERYNKEYQLLRKTWRKYVKNDPYYNKNLSKNSVTFEINISNE